MGCDRVVKVIPGVIRRRTLDGGHPGAARLDWRGGGRHRGGPAGAETCRALGSTNPGRGEAAGGGGHRLSTGVRSEWCAVRSRAVVSLTGAA